MILIKAALLFILGSITGAITAVLTVNRNNNVQVGGNNCTQIQIERTEKQHDMSLEAQAMKEIYDSVKDK
jgi:hypothetical protein